MARELSNKSTRSDLCPVLVLAPEHHKELVALLAEDRTRTSTLVRPSTLLATSEQAVPHSKQQKLEEKGLKHR